jgi:pimeloyl-ACP methyl ester carboxylesterase
MPTVKPVYAIFIHGVGEQNSHFADYAQRKLSAGLSKRGYTLYARSVHWAPLMDLNSTRFLKAARAKGSVVNPAQKLVANTLSDALAYHADRPVAQQIYGVYDYEVLALRGEPVYIFAHSLGGLITCDYLRTRTKLKVARFVTFGCNIPLFYLGATFTPPAQVASPGTWNNLFYDSDMLGYPVSEEENLSHVVDQKIEPAPGLRFSDIIPGLTHVDYFGDSRLWGETIPNVLGFRR